MVLMYRLFRPRTYVNAVHFYGRNIHLWRKVFNCMIDYTFMRCNHLLNNNLEYFHRKFQLYNLNIHEAVN